MLCRDRFSVLLLLLALTALSAPAAANNGNGHGAKYKGGQIVVEGKPETFAADYEIVKYLPHANLTVLKVERGKEWGQLQKERAKGRRAGLNLEVEAFMAVNDPYYSPYQWHFDRVQSQQAWDLTDGAGVTVAVLDTGLKANGPDGFGCVLPGWDAVNGDFDPDDGNRHGTHVAGTVAQSTNNGTRGAGLAHGACVLPVKVLADDGSGSFADVADGIYWAVDNGAQVINMSLGTAAQALVTSDPLVDPALDYAHANGVTVVCASGNNYSRDNVSYPAIHATTIAVGATDFADGVTAYSNGGLGLDLVAPGGDMNQDLNGDGFGDGVLQESLCGADWCSLFLQGTSMAAPHVAAAAAMLYASGVATTPDAVRLALTSSAQNLGPAGWDADSGAGLLQVHAALTGGGGGSCTDVDGDGWCTSDGDCDDLDAAVNPGAAEECGDGVDNNCDGQVDEGCSCDGDGDGWCPADGDCDDSDGSVNPGEAEVCDDGVDNNCDGQVDEGCAPPPGPPIDLDARKGRKKGSKVADLSWNGAAAGQMDVYRNGDLVATTDNDGFFQDELGKKARGSFVYRVCEMGTGDCSNEDVVEF